MLSTTTILLLTQVSVNREGLGWDMVERGLLLFHTLEYSELCFTTCIITFIIKKANLKLLFKKNNKITLENWALGTRWQRLWRPLGRSCGLPDDKGDGRGLAEDTVQQACERSCNGDNWFAFHVIQVRHRQRWKHGGQSLAWVFPGTSSLVSLSHLDIPHRGILHTWLQGLPSTDFFLSFLL